MAAGGASYGGHLTKLAGRYHHAVQGAGQPRGLYDQVSQWTTSDIAWPREVTMGGPAWEKPPLWQSQQPHHESPGQPEDADARPPQANADYRVPVNNTLQLCEHPAAAAGAEPA